MVGTRRYATLSLVLLLAPALGSCASSPCPVPERLAKDEHIEIRHYDPGCPLATDGSWVAEDAGELAEQLDCFAAGGRDPSPVDFDREVVHRFTFGPGRAEVHWITRTGDTATVGVELWEDCSDQPPTAALTLLIPRDVETVRLHECERHTCERTPDHLADP